MPDPRQCPQCGCELASSAPKGLCPKCLLGAALGPLSPRIDQPLLSPEPEIHEKIGSYRVLQKLGEGGSGIVYMAEQEKPIRRRVALKLIKLGMDTKEVIARFEAERQALALMDHPNIAKVLDAGASEAGRPYFVMELVRGSKITQYCDQYCLSTRERLQLFLQVCRAIQHAHQKGIIHRDIKPSNILVTQQDSRAVPLVIDFGIAKATGGQVLTDKTVFTAIEQFIGTPAYMSPEQAAGKWDIDTRTDIYSLGVLLYELLTGKTLFDSKALLHAGWDAMRQTIRETEPQSPSTRLTTLAPMELNRIAKNRRAEAPKLIHFLRGDLDWIVMKCLEKETARRYDSCSAIADDIQRHLKREPVLARRATNFYRFQRFVSRNQVLVVAGIAVLTALVIGLAASTWFFVKERQARKEARAAQEQAEEAEKKSRLREEDALASEAKLRKATELFIDRAIKRKFPEDTAGVGSSNSSPAQSLRSKGFNSESNQPPKTQLFSPYSVGLSLVEPTEGFPAAYDPVVPPTEYEGAYSAWAAKWWGWFMGLSLIDGGIPHPGVSTALVDVTQGQDGEVWFLASPFGAWIRDCVIPQGKWLFVGLLNVESSDLEEDSFLFFGLTAAEQAAKAGSLADHIADVSCEIDGISVPDMSRFRFANPQISFFAPTPWIFGGKGGGGTSSGDGYYIYLRPFPPGHHVIHYKGVFRLPEADFGFDLEAPIEMTYRITVR
jgi:serine/threonine protein kinase